MTSPQKIKEVFERNAKAIKLRPSMGKSTGKSTIRVENGTTCKIEGSGWNLTADIGTEQGGNNAGPGPGVLERAALGSCLALGYVQHAALMEIPIDNLLVEVETDFDARGMFGIEDRPPGFTKICYTLYLESPASDAELKKVIAEVDKYSPVRDDFSRAVPIESKVIINRT
ncbi:MAG TPA: OsmC family protein [Flavobacteriaceae bacterium]|nr:OsmC family protein [Flavobacteriaceae bacterium]